MNYTLVTILTVSLYFAVSAYQYWLLKKQDQTHIKRVALLAILPLLMHGFQLHLLIDTDFGQNLSMLNLISMLFWIIGIALVISSLLKKLEILVLAVFPISAQVALIAGISSNEYIIDASDPGFLTHILIAISAISILGLAAIQSVFVTVLDNKLKAQPTNINLALPPLQDMERFLYILVVSGFILLTLAIVTAILFIPSTGGDYSLHKPVLSIMSWLVLGTFLFGHYKYGWRGKKAAHWTLTGFILLFLAYFGTRTVLEVILS